MLHVTHETKKSKVNMAEKDWDEDGRKMIQTLPAVLDLKSKHETLHILRYHISFSCIPPFFRIFVAIKLIVIFAYNLRVV